MSTTTDTTWLDKIELVGESFYEKEWKQLMGKKASWKGTATFRAEPSNPYDSNAVTVHVGDLLVGRIAKTDTEHFHKAVPSGFIETPFAVVRIGGDWDGWPWHSAFAEKVPASDRQLGYIEDMLDAIDATDEEYAAFEALDDYRKASKMIDTLKPRFHATFADENINNVGDVVDGFILGENNVWHKLEPETKPNTDVVTEPAVMSLTAALVAAFIFIGIPALLLSLVFTPVVFLVSLPIIYLVAKKARDETLDKN